MIFCVEDDDSSRELMIYTLLRSGFEARGFASASAFWEAMRSEKPELIILDIMLPDEDGISILKKLRSYVVTADIPVIMASARGNEYDKVIGLDLGADDYLAKPFGMMEMLSRVRAVLRRTEKGKKDTILRAGTIELNPLEHTVKVNGKKVDLTLKEYDLLQLLLANRGRVFTRDALLSYVWDEDFSGETRTVDVHIGTLRTKLGDQADLIRTVRGVGYKLEER